MSATANERIGTELLGYRIEALLGRGGMGVVYRAHDLRLKRNVALKLLVPELAEDERFRERFLRESELAASLDHPNVIPIYEAGEADGVLYVAMRLVDGKDLRTLLAEEGKLDPARALEIAGQVATALDAAHEHGLVHRDVKPSNVLLDKREHVYLADFGLTRRLGDPAVPLGASFSLGTPAYVAPEQIRDTEVDGRADEYSLCCLLHECLTGKPPFPRASEAGVLFAHLEEEPPAPERLAHVMAAGLAKQPIERYPACIELVAAARAALGIGEPKRARWPYAIAGTGAALLAAALLAYALESGTTVGPARVKGNAVAVVDTHSNQVVEQIPVGARPDAITSGSGSLWITNLDDKTVQRLDPTTRRVIRTFAIGDTPTDIAASNQAVWVVGSDPTDTAVRVARIDPQFDLLSPATLLASVVPGGGGSVGTRAGAVWVAPTYGLLSRLNPATGEAVQTVDPSGAASGLALTRDALWLSDTDAGTVTRIGRSGRLTPIRAGRSPGEVAAGLGAVWVADSLDDAVLRIDPGTRRVIRIPVGRGPEGLAVGAGALWVANARDGTVMRIDPATNTVRATVRVGGSPQRIAVADGRLWVTVQAEHALPAAPSGGTAHLVAQSDAGPIDPGVWAGQGDPQLLHATCAMLLNYPDEPWPRGARLVAEVAASMPTLSRDRRTYTFTIRKGFRFSPPSNEPVTAASFKYAIERSSRMDPGAAGGLLHDIAGLQAYLSGYAPHISGLAAHGNRLVIRLVAPAPDFLVRLSMPHTCAVPLGTPPVPGGLRIVASAGPYYVASYTPGQGLVLEQNPNYGGNRPHRLERIEVAFGLSRERMVAEIESGAADYALGNLTVPPEDVERLAARYGPRSPAAKRGAQRFFLQPFPWLHFFLLNSERPLFQDVRMRRAVNYAIDRRALARVGGTYTTTAAPTDQYLPPGFPGFRDVHLYPFAPDLAAARRLAGTKRRTAVLYTCNDSPCLRLARIVRENLSKIGIDVEIRAFPQDVLYRTYTGSSGTPAAWDLALANWIPFTTDPASALNEPLEAVDGVFPRLESPAYRARLAAAARLSGSTRYLAYQQLDADLARDAAPWLPYANELRADLFSARMGCQVYNPAPVVHGIDLAALCIKES